MHPSNIKYLHKYMQMHNYMHSFMHIVLIHRNTNTYMQRHGPMKHYLSLMVIDICLVLKIRIQGSPAYIGLCLDVGSSMAKQSYHLGATLTSGCDQGGGPILYETKSTIR